MYLSNNGRVGLQVCVEGVPFDEAESLIQEALSGFTEFCVDPADYALVIDLADECFDNTNLKFQRLDEPLDSEGWYAFSAVVIDEESDGGFAHYRSRCRVRITDLVEYGPTKH